MRYTLTFPWPHKCTTNHQWRKSLRGGVYLSPEVQRFREQVCTICTKHHVKRVVGPVRIEIEAYPPDKRKRDIDNIVKPVLDAMSYACAWVDDVQIADLRVIRMPRVKGGELRVMWCEKGGADDV